MMPAARSRLHPLLAAACFLALLTWAWDDLQLWLRPFVERAVYTSGLPRARVDCLLPAEHERLVVVFSWRDGKLTTQCMFVGSRGSYSRKGTAL